MESPQRKILIVEDDASMRNILYMLVARLGCETESASSGNQALAMVKRDRFDAVLLDLRCINLQSEEVIPQIQNLCPNLLGRVLVISGDVTDPAAMRLIEDHFLLNVPRDRLVDDLQGYLRVLLGIRPASNAVA